MQYILYIFVLDDSKLPQHWLLQDMPSKACSPAGWRSLKWWVGGVVPCITGGIRSGMNPTNTWNVHRQHIVKLFLLWFSPLWPAMDNVVTLAQTAALEVTVVLISLLISSPNQIAVWIHHEQSHDLIHTSKDLTHWDCISWLVSHPAPIWLHCNIPTTWPWPTHMLHETWWVDQDSTSQREVQYKLCSAWMWPGRWSKVTGAYLIATSVARMSHAHDYTPINVQLSHLSDVIGHTKEEYIYPCILIND